MLQRIAGTTPAAIGRGAPAAPDGAFFAAFVEAGDRRALRSAGLPARALPNRAELIAEGDRSDRLFVLLDGWAARCRTLRDGSRQIVALVVPGEPANLDALLFGPSDAGVVALTPLRVLALPLDRVAALAAAHPAIGMTLTALALKEGRIHRRWALCLGRMTARQRLAHLLCELDERLPAGGRRAAGRFDLPLTQEQIADALGITPVHVNRMLRVLRTAGLVAVERGTVTIADRPALRELAEFDGGYLADPADREAA